MAGRGSRQRVRRRPRRASLQRAKRRGSGGRQRVAFRQRGNITVERGECFAAPEDWHEPRGDGRLEIVRQAPGRGYVHAVTPDEVRDRIAQLPERFRHVTETVQLSRMTRKKALFPNYGMQWGTAVYLYPIEESLVETYVRPPRPEQLVEARMFGGRWEQDGETWHLHWTPESLRDFYLDNVLIHEIGHVVDDRNTTYVDRERYAEWFAIEYGYRKRS